MGYPMTFQRFVNRNGLKDGSYDKVPERHRKGVITNGTEATAQTEEETILGRAPYWCERIEQYDQAFRMLAGDLRRLENDATDEASVCRYIAGRTQLDEDTVAAVLKEFIAW